MPKPGAAYHCPSCRKSGTPKDASGVQLRSAKKRLKGAPGTPSARPSQAIGGSPFRGKVQPPTLIVENPAAEEAAGALQMDPSMGVGELGLTPGTMARLGLDSGFGTASFAEEQQELEADSELAMLLRTGSDVDLASIGGGLLGSLQSPEGLAFLRTGASDGGASAKAVEPQPAGAGESTEQEGGPARPGTAKMAAFKVPPLIVNSFVSPGASSGSPFGMLFSQRSDQVALPNFLPGQLDTPNVAGSGLWSSPPVDAPPGSQLDATPGAAEEAGKNGLGGAETPRGGALSAEEKQRVRERLSQLDTPTQVRLQRFLEAEKAKQDAQWAQVENFMQKHSRLQAERENAALRPPALSPPFRGGPSPGPLQGLLGSPSQHAFLPLTAEQTYLRPDALDHHPLLSPPDRPDPQSQETALPPRSGSAPEPAGYWEGRPFYREPAPHRLPFPGGSASRPMGPPFPGIGPPGPPSPEEMHGRQIELAKRMATNANAAETFLKKLPPQLAKELQDRFPEGVPPSVLSAIAQHLVRVSTQQQQQASPHARPSPPQVCSTP